MQMKPATFNHTLGNSGLAFTNGLPKGKPPTYQELSADFEEVARSSAIMARAAPYRARSVQGSAA
jgi:hypothetical protein